jgi:hypothetical protein
MNFKDIDRKLIRLAFHNPDMRKNAIYIVASGDSQGLVDFAGDRKWKNPDTGNQISFNTVLSLSSGDDPKIWAKAVVKKVTEEYNKYKKENVKSDTSTQKGIIKKIQAEIEGEIANFKKYKDITSTKDREEFEKYLDDKLARAQDKLYQEKVSEITGMNEKEYNKASEELDKEFARVTKDLNRGQDLAKSIGDTLGDSNSMIKIIGGGGLGALAGVFGATIAGLGTGGMALIPAVLMGAWELKKKFDAQPDEKKRAELKAEFDKRKQEKLDELNKKKDDELKVQDKELKYKGDIKKEQVDASVKEFFQDDKFDDPQLGDDLTIDELYELSQESDNPKDKERATKLLEDKKKEYLAVKFNREKALKKEVKNKKFKSTDGKRYDIDEMFKLEESGDAWASNKLKELRQSIEGVEEVEEEEREEEETEPVVEKDNPVAQLAQLQQELDSQNIQVLYSGQAEEELEDLFDDEDDDDEIDISQAPEPVQQLVQQIAPKKQAPKKPSKKDDSKPTTEESKAKVPLKGEGVYHKDDVKAVLDSMQAMREQAEKSLKATYGKQKFKNPDGKEITFKSLQTLASESSAGKKHHAWAVKTMEGLRKKINKKGAEKLDEVDQLVKDKFEKGLTVNPQVLKFFEMVNTNGKFDPEKLKAIMKEVEEAGKIFGGEPEEDKKSKKKASLEIEKRNTLIRIAYHNPELRKEILPYIK